MRIKISITIAGLLIMSSCNIFSSKDEDMKVVEITKWYNDYASAFTPTFDAGLPSIYEAENEWLIQNNLFMDYEIVSASYDVRPERVEFLKEKLIPAGFGYFGHGHAHENHDNLSYEEALSSFSQNFNSIKSYDLQPISYAYPNGAGLKQETRKALEEAGFLSGRLNQTVFEDYGPYIIPDNEKLPVAWYALPALRMEDYDFNQCDYCINNPEEFFSYLYENIKQRSWLINTYHAIGFDGVTDGRPVGWGFYRHENFYSEMSEVKKLQEEGEIWLVTMNDVTLYIYQRNATIFNLEKVHKTEYELMLSSDLDSLIFNHPLTLRLKLNSDFIGSQLLVFDQDKQLFDKKINKNELLLNLKAQEYPYTLKIQQQ